LNSPPRPEAAANLALAVIASSTAPLLLLDGDCTVIAASDSFCRAFQLEPANVVGRAVGKLASGEWAIPQLDAQLRAMASGTAQVDGYEMDLEQSGQGVRCLVLDAHKLDYGNSYGVRFLLSIADVTDARVAEKIKDDLVRERSILLQELQHRVANDLQIIASVLMQSARRVRSDETRVHLHDAHSPVMSVAALQQQLATSTLGDVELRTYFTDLCHSIGEVGDPRRQSTHARRQRR
jgi:two-component system, sensor histidine kinase PdtaS